MDTITRRSNLKIAVEDEVPDRAELRVADVVSAVRARWTWLLCAVIVTTAAGAAIAFLSTPEYRANAVLEPSESDRSEGTMASIADTLGGLADIAGAGMSLTSENRHAQEAIATLESRALVEQFVQDNHLLPVLFPKQWDAARGHWKQDVRKPPTLWDASQRFRKIRTVDYDRSTGLVTLAIEWKDPKVAASWANELIRRTNDLLRDRAIERAQRSLAYLESEKDRVNEVDVRQALFQLEETEIKTIMLAKGSQEYAFRIIDPPETPQLKSWPPRKLLIAGGAAVGLMVGALLAMLASRPRRRDI